jgi:hypothetical protein
VYGIGRVEFSDGSYLNVICFVYQLFLSEARSSESSSKLFTKHLVIRKPLNPVSFIRLHYQLRSALELIGLY